MHPPYRKSAPGRILRNALLKEDHMSISPRWIWVPVVVSLAVLLSMTVPLPVVQGAAEHVRWDIISINFVPPFTVSAGGIASTKANDGSTITLTGSGTFVAPAGGPRNCCARPARGPTLPSPL